MSFDDLWPHLRFGLDNASPSGSFLGAVSGGVCGDPLRLSHLDRWVIRNADAQGRWRTALEHSKSLILGPPVVPFCQLVWGRFSY